MTAWWTTAWDWAMICLTGATAGVIVAGVIIGAGMVVLLAARVVFHGVMWMWEAVERAQARYHVRRWNKNAQATGPEQTRDGEDHGLQ